MFKLNFRNLIMFFCVWGPVGFVMGTEILMGPSRWVVELARSRPALFFIEGPAIRTMIVLLVAVSLTVSLFLTRTILTTTKRHVRYGLITILTVFFLATLYMWFNPKKFGNDVPTVAQNTERFVVGSYPDREQLIQLKKDGFTAVISLLHPAVVPFETSLISSEKANTKEVGIEMIHLPMLPWISQNVESLSRLREIAASGKGKYYLHCYLGKDRVSVAMKTIVDADTSFSGMLGERARKISERRTFERGRIYTPEKDVYVTPYPTDAEYFAYIIAANITNIVCLMHPAEGNSSKIITRSEEVLNTYGIKQVNYPIRREKYDSSQVIEAVRAVKSMNKPVVVFDFSCPSFRTEAFIQAYTTEQPVFPPALLNSNKLMVGKVEHIGPGVVIGPRPTHLKAWIELEELGIKKFLYIGRQDDAAAVRDLEFTTVGEFDWQIIRPVIEEASSILKQDGPWYVYGPGSAGITPLLKERLDPVYKDPPDWVNRRMVENAVPPSPTRFQFVLQSFHSSTKPTIRHPVELGIHFIMTSMPTVKTIILFTPFCFLYAYICACYSGWLRVKKNVRTSYTRKVFHFLIFTMACFVQVLGGIQATVLYGTVVSCCVLYTIFRGDGFDFYEALARPSDAPHRTLYIFVPLVTTALGGVLANIFFQPVAMIGYLVGGWGDAVGEPVGAKWGKHRYKVFSMMGVPATRSLEGSAAVMAASFVAAVTGLLLMGAPLGLAASAAVICALVAVFVEALSTHGMDNLTVQVAASAVIYFLLMYII